MTCNYVYGVCDLTNLQSSNYFVVGKAELGIKRSSNGEDRKKSLVILKHFLEMRVIEKPYTDTR